MSKLILISPYFGVFCYISLILDLVISNDGKGILPHLLIYGMLGSLIVSFAQLLYIVVRKL